MKVSAAVVFVLVLVLGWTGAAQSHTSSGAGCEGNLVSLADFQWVRSVREGREFVFPQSFSTPYRVTTLGGSEPSVGDKALVENLVNQIEDALSVLFEQKTSGFNQLGFEDTWIGSIEFFLDPNASDSALDRKPLWAEFTLSRGLRLVWDVRSARAWSEHDPSGFAFHLARFASFFYFSKEHKAEELWSRSLFAAVGFHPDPKRLQRDQNLGLETKEMTEYNLAVMSSRSSRALFFSMVLSPKPLRF